MADQAGQAEPAVAASRDGIEALLAGGILLCSGGEVRFKFDCFRAFFLAQMFNTSAGLLKYAFTQQGFTELQPELGFYTGLRQDNIEHLTALEGKWEPAPLPNMDDADADAAG